MDVTEPVFRVVCARGHAECTLRTYRRGWQQQWWLYPTLSPKSTEYSCGSDDELRAVAHGDLIRLRCRVCGLDEKHALGRVYGRDYPPFSEVFQTLWSNGVSAIDARRLVALVRQQPVL